MASDISVSVASGDRLKNDGSNYGVWKFQMTNMLKSNACYDVTVTNDDENVLIAAEERQKRRKRKIR